MILDADAVVYVQGKTKYRSPCWHGQQFPSWRRLLLAMAPGQRAVADVRYHVLTLARRAGRKIHTRKRSDGLLEIICRA